MEIYFEYELEYVIHKYRYCCFNKMKTDYPEWNLITSYLLIIVHNSIVQILISTLIIPFVLFDIILFALSIDYSIYIISNLISFSINIHTIWINSLEKTFLTNMNDICVSSYLIRNIKYTLRSKNNTKFNLPSWISSWRKKISSCISRSAYFNNSRWM